MRFLPLLAVLSCATARPPSLADAAGAQTLRYSVLMAARSAGNAFTVIKGGARAGERDSHFEYTDRGRGPSLDATLKLGAGGLPLSIAIRGYDYLKSPIDERYDGVTRTWSNQAEKGSSDKPGALYVPLTDLPEMTAVIARALLQAAGSHLPLLPSGEARLTRVNERTLGGADGAKAHATLYALDGFGFFPAYFWLDDQNELFGSVSNWLSVIRQGFEKAAPDMIVLQDQAVAAHLEGIARDSAHAPKGPLALVHARVFDAEGKRALTDQTILIEGGRIVQVGPSAQVVAPGNAEVMDLAGKTVLPGLWDMHVHIGDGDGLLHLANGVTTVRDLANDMEKVETLQKRFESGVELGPRLLLAGFIDGRGPFAGPTKVFADTPEEAIAAVDKYAERGYLQIKVYSSLKPELVPIIAKEAHAKGMRFSGHVPAHMIAEDAVRAGFDELQHINFVLLEFVGNRETETQTMARLTLPAEKAGDLDLDSTAVRDFIALLLEHHTVIDSTLGVFEADLTDRPGTISSTVRAVGDRLPPQVARNFKAGGLPAKDAAQDARFRRSYAKMAQMVHLLWSKGVTLVAGTDTLPGFGLIRELETYAEAGIPNADVLQIATLGAARVMKRDQQSGSIAAGKDADLLVVDGDPLADISDLRKPVLVIKAGKSMKPGDLLRAINVQPRAGR